MSSLTNFRTEFAHCVHTPVICASATPLSNSGFFVVFARAAISFLSLLFICCSGAYADNLIRLKACPVSGSGPAPVAGAEVIVQSQFYKVTTYVGLRKQIYVQPKLDKFSYWFFGEGQLRKLTADKDCWSFVLAPDKLESIRDQWKSQGFTVDIEYRNRITPSRLQNAFFLPVAPEGQVLASILFGDVSDYEDRRKNALGVISDRASPTGSGLSVTTTDKVTSGIYASRTLYVSIPIEDIDSLEFRDNGSLLVSRRDGTSFPAHVPDEMVGDKALVPTISGFTYELGGAVVEKPEDPDRPYFKEQSIPFAQVRRITFVKKGTSSSP